MPSENEMQARLDGQMAKLQKKQPTDNPYPLGTSASREWSRGYREIV